MRPYAVRRDSIRKLVWSLSRDDGDSAPAADFACGGRPQPRTINRTMVDHLALATSMVTLQSQVGECCAEMQQLQLDWQATSARLKADQEAMRYV